MSPISVVCVFLVCYDGLRLVDAVFSCVVATFVRFPSIRIKKRVPPANFVFDHFVLSNSTYLATTYSAMAKHVAIPRIQRNSKIESGWRSTKIFSKSRSKVYFFFYTVVHVQNICITQFICILKRGENILNGSADRAQEFLDNFSSRLWFGFVQSISFVQKTGPFLASGLGEK